MESIVRAIIEDRIIQLWPVYPVEPNFQTLCQARSKVTSLLNEFRPHNSKLYDAFAKANIHLNLLQRYIDELQGMIHDPRTDETTEDLVQAQIKAYIAAEGATERSPLCFASRMARHFNGYGYGPFKDILASIVPLLKEIIEKFNMIIVRPGNPPADMEDVEKVGKWLGIHYPSIDKLTSVIHMALSGHAREKLVQLNISCYALSLSSVGPPILVLPGLNADSDLFNNIVKWIITTNVTPNVCD